MNGAQVAMIVVFTIGLVTSAIEDNTPRKPPFDRVHFNITVIRFAVLAAILWWGGFWKWAT